MSGIQISSPYICGDGLIGSALARDFRVSLVPAAVSQSLKRPHAHTESVWSNVASWLEAFQPTVFVNAAGPSNVAASAESPLDFTTKHLDQVQSHIATLSRLSTPPSYVYVSSAAVYGCTPTVGARETDPTLPVSAYGQGKLMVEDWLCEIANEYAGRITVLRVFSAYSQNLRSRLPWILASEILSTGAVALSGTGGETRDFIHTSDISSAVTAVQGQTAAFDVFNVGSGHGLTVLQVSEIATKALLPGYTKPDLVHFNGMTRPTDPEHLVANIEKLKSLGWTPTVRPEDGLRNYFEGIRHAPDKN